MRKTGIVAALVAVAALAVNAGGIKHPSLLFTPAKVAAAKQRMAHDTVQAIRHWHG